MCQGETYEKTASYGRRPRAGCVFWPFTLRESAKMWRRAPTAGGPLVPHASGIRDDEVDTCNAIIVGGSLHEGRYQREVRTFIENHKAILGSRPSAFFSVSLAAASRDSEERAEAVRIAQAFTAHAGWTPGRIASFAGALKYTQYSWLKRMLMKRISAKEGGDTDTSRDHEYTDWDEVSRFVEEMTGALQCE